MLTAIGMIESTSIAMGFSAADAMLKAGDVELLSATAVCPGKYYVIIHGNIAAVESAIKAGKSAVGDYLVDDFILANVHPGVFPAITSTTPLTNIRALGILESFSIATMIVAADAALKAANVDAIDLRIGSGLGGKSYFTMTGDVASVQAAVEAGAASAIEKGLLVEKVVISSPAKELISAIF